MEGDALHHPEIGDVAVQSAGNKKSASSSRDSVKLFVLGDLRNAFERSVFNTAAMPKNPASEPNVDAYEKLLSSVNIGGKELVAIFTVQRQKGGRNYYNTVTLEDGKEKTPAVSPRDTPANRERATPAYTEVSTFIRHPLRRVNPDSVSPISSPRSQTRRPGNRRWCITRRAWRLEQFDPKKPGAGQFDYETPFGIFTKPDSRDIGLEGENTDAAFRE
jgi:hypothetical protein